MLGVGCFGEGGAGRGVVARGSAVNERNGWEVIGERWGDGARGDVVRCGSEEGMSVAVFLSRSMRVGVLMVVRRSFCVRKVYSLW